MGNSQRSAKIKELNATLKKARTEMEGFLKHDEKDFTEADKKAHLQNITSLRAVVMALNEELTLTVKNRLSSSFFEYYPSGANRKQRRAFSKRVRTHGTT